MIASLSTFDREDTIYAAEPWTADSEAMVVREPDAGGVPQAASEKGMTYFIEIFIAHDFLDGWQQNETRALSSEEQCAGLIHYAIYDA
ncbi:MAG TPA: hypothetical protein VKE95_19975 [Burkholderiales bacterium]|nr:hypothetical protein [Burkholderiales bacterium]